MKIRHILIMLLVLFNISYSGGVTNASKNYVKVEEITFNEWKKLLKNMENMMELSAKDFLKKVNLQNLNPNDEKVLRDIKQMKLKLYKEFITDYIPKDILQKIKATRILKKEAYRYMEIDECTIPILKKYKTAKAAITYRYEFENTTYTESKDQINFFSTAERKKNLEEFKTLINSITKYRIDTRKKEKKQWKNFKVFKNKIENGYMIDLFGEKTILSFVNISKAELNYLMDYCNKTRKNKEIDPIPPETLYVAVEEEYLETALDKGLVAPKGQAIELSLNRGTALALKGNYRDLHLLKIQSAQMQKDGAVFNKENDYLWYTTVIESKYITLIR